MPVLAWIIQTVLASAIGHEGTVHNRFVFVDEATVFAKAGEGGAGRASIRREPFTPRGGPDGGDGGRGGDVLLVVDRSVSDLSSLADHPHQRAQNGKSGSGNKRHGARGRDLVLAVPNGTVVRGEQGLIADLVGPGASVVVARGGRGGRGNAALASARDRIPRVAEAGEPGEELRLELELRLVADVALVGAPNAGKSTLLSRLTAARPKIASYPFTTLTPNLGVAGGADERVVVADVPGLIEGAHQGRGLGLTFLRHISRCRVLVFVVDLSDDPERDLSMLRSEIAAFDSSLLDRASLVVGTKADLLPDPQDQHATGVDLAVSGLTAAGIPELGHRLHDLTAATAAAEPAETTPYVVLRPARQPFVISREGARFRVSGRHVERWVAGADLDDEQEVVALQRRLARAGVEKRLAEAGARRGDEVVIGSSVFEFIPESGDAHTGAHGEQA
jgi:GTP-binding protein